MLMHNSSPLPNSLIMSVIPELVNEVEGWGLTAYTLFKMLLLRNLISDKQ